MVSLLLELKKSLKEVRGIAGRMGNDELETPLHKMKVKSYILLSHGVIEEYLENKSLQICEQAISELSQNKISYCISSLVAFYKFQYPTILTHPPSVGHVTEFLVDAAEQCIIQHQEIISNNHGIRKKSLDRLFRPLGIDVDKVAPGLKASLDAFGQKRGTFAHGVGAHVQDTKGGIRQELNGIVSLLELFDQGCSICQKREVTLS
ncbi:HEPN domain-containing protein [Ponticaulis profundi]|uniref:HEPN domain-containing protein n=1 Tax=Ponticaulis profundi TaxID=2665222 RepID=A0ABW1S902_9PROT